MSKPESEPDPTPEETSTDEVTEVEKDADKDEAPAKKSTAAKKTTAKTTAKSATAAATGKAAKGSKSSDKKTTDATGKSEKSKGEKSGKSEKSRTSTATKKPSPLARLRRDDTFGDRPPVVTVRLVVMVALILAGIAYIVMTWRALGANPLENWALYDVLGEEKTRRWVWELDKWNYAIGFGAILIGLIVGAHKSTPLGRGNGVVVGMLLCFGIGLLWICTFYLFADNITDIWILGALGQWNLVVGIAFFAVGFSYATKWE